MLAVLAMSTGLHSSCAAGRRGRRSFSMLGLKGCGSVKADDDTLATRDECHISPHRRWCRCSFISFDDVTPQMSRANERGQAFHPENQQTRAPLARHWAWWGCLLQKCSAPVRSVSVSDDAKIVSSGDGRPVRVCGTEDYARFILLQLDASDGTASTKVRQYECWLCLR